MRSSNDISLKKPIRQVSLIWDTELEQRYSGRFKDYLGMVVDECNLLDIRSLSKSDVSINKSIVPVKSLFFKKYGKDIGLTFESLSQMNSDMLEQIIGLGEFNGFLIEPTMFNYNYDIKLSTLDLTQSDNIIYKEFNFGNYKDKIIVLMDKSWSESNDKIYSFGYA